MHRNRIQQAFTLIELMLTLAVMAALLTVGLNAFQQKMQNTKMDRAALQMQYWLQAGMAYRNNSDNDKWPENMTVLVSKGYIKNFSNPWRKCEMSNVDQCYAIATISDTDSFQVQMKIPKAVPNVQNLAKLLVQHLPNAEICPEAKCGGDNVVVLAEVPMIAGSAARSDVIIKNIQIYSSEGRDPFSNTPMPLSDIRLTKCPKGKRPDRFYSLIGSDLAYDQRSSLSTYLGTMLRLMPGNEFDKAKIYQESAVFEPIGKYRPSYSGQTLVIDACMPDRTLGKPTVPDMFQY